MKCCLWQREVCGRWHSTARALRYDVSRQALSDTIIIVSFVGKTARPIAACEIRSFFALTKNASKQSVHFFRVFFFGGVQKGEDLELYSAACKAYLDDVAEL